MKTTQEYWDIIENLKKATKNQRSKIKQLNSKLEDHYKYRCPFCTWKRGKVVHKCTWHEEKE